MFRFWRRKKVEERARSVANLMLLFVSNVSSMSLEQFIEANRRRGFINADIDFQSRVYSFFECDIANADFGFSVDYGANDAPVASGQGYGDYFGLYLSGRKPGEVVVDYRRQGARGCDAQALWSALLRFPGFSTAATLRPPTYPDSLSP
jgi:hypothetical protein